MKTEPRLQEFLARSGYRFDTLDEGVFVVAFSDDDADQPVEPSDPTTVYMKEDEAGMLLAILPFISTPRPESAPMLYRKLLTLNFDLTRCQFAIDLDGDVALKTWIPETTLAYDEWHDSLEYLVNVATLLRPALEGPGTEASI